MFTIPRADRSAGAGERTAFVALRNQDWVRLVTSIFRIILRPHTFKPQEDLPPANPPRSPPILPYNGSQSVVQNTSFFTWDASRGTRCGTSLPTGSPSSRAVIPPTGWRNAADCLDLRHSRGNSIWVNHFQAFLRYRGRSPTRNRRSSHIHALPGRRGVLTAPESPNGPRGHQESSWRINGRQSATERHNAWLPAPDSHGLHALEDAKGRSRRDGHRVLNSSYGTESPLYAGVAGWEAVSRTRPMAERADFPFGLKVDKGDR